MNDRRTLSHETQSRLCGTPSSQKKLAAPPTVRDFPNLHNHECRVIEAGMDEMTWVHFGSIGGIGDEVRSTDLSNAGCNVDR